MMRGNKTRMEKLLQVLLYIGITFFVVGTVTACNIKDDKIKEAATTVEVPSQVQSELEEKEEELSEYEKAIETELDKQDIQESTEEELNEEMAYFWNLYKEILKPYTEKGLTWEVFTNIYSLYRSGNEDVVSAHDAYQLTYKEIVRRYEETNTEKVDIGFAENITRNEDGTYEYSDVFMAEVKKYPYFNGATDEEITDFLDNTLGYFAGEEEFIDSEMMNDLLSAFDNGNLHEENLVIKESESGQTQEADRNNTNSSTTQQPEQQPTTEPEIITDPNYTITTDNPAFDGIDFDSEFGGGELGNIDLEIH